MLGNCEYFAVWRSRCDSLKSRRRGSTEYTSDREARVKIDEAMSMHVHSKVEKTEVGPQNSMRDVREDENPAKRTA